MSQASPQAQAGAEPAFAPLDMTASRQLVSWLAEQRVSLAFTTYQAGFLVFIGRGPDGMLAHHRRGLTRCMGMVAHAGALHVSALFQIWRFENALAPGEQHQGHDRLYVPKVSHVTGDLDVHDLAVDAEGRLHMRYTARTRSIAWKADAATQDAAESSMSDRSRVRLGVRLHPQPAMAGR